MKIQLFHGDCLEVMKSLPDASVDMVLSDLPYGVLDCAWDRPLPLPPLWNEFWRVLKPSGAVVLTAVQPFTTFLISSQIDHFKYCWIWRKTKSTGFVHARNMPLRNYEDVCVFSRAGVKPINEPGSRMAYFPQNLAALPTPKVIPAEIRTNGGVGGRRKHRSYVRTMTNYPAQVLEFPSVANPIHPTEKPVSLLEFLIKTYTTDGEVVLDGCMGSGSAGVACVNTNRSFVGIEKNREFFELARNRIYTIPKMAARDENPQARGARKTHFIRVSKHEVAIQRAIEDLKRRKCRITKSAVAKIVGLSRQQITQRYSHLFINGSAEDHHIKPVSPNFRRKRAARELAKVAAE